MSFAIQAAAHPAPATMAYADCLSGRINADPRMVHPPAEREARLAIHDDARLACATLRAAAPASEHAMLDRIDASTRAVLEDPAAAEQVDGDLADDMPQA